MPVLFVIFAISCADLRIFAPFREMPSLSVIFAISCADLLISGSLRPSVRCLSSL